jgi:hypothetical protein
MQLSKHFTLLELTRSQTAKRLDIKNEPSAAEIKCLKELCENILEPIRVHFGKPLVLSSVYRSPALNKAIGGASTSQHVKGQAADLEIAGVANAAIYAYILDNLDFDQLIAEKLKTSDGGAGWIHVSYNKGKNRGEALSFLGGGRYVKGLVFV